jgi:hypothetical protein
MARHEDTSLLAAALAGYQVQLANINASITDIRKRLGKLGGDGAAVSLTNAPRRKKHVISAEGRARIAAAQHRRWEAAKKGK